MLTQTHVHEGDTWDVTRKTPDTGHQKKQIPNNMQVKIYSP